MKLKVVKGEDIVYKLRMAREFNNPEEAAIAAEWQAAYEEELRGGGENPIVEFFTYVCFASFSAGKGRNKRSMPRYVELVGERGGGKKYQLKNSELPHKLQKRVELKLGTDDYDKVVENLRRAGKR